MTGYRDAREKLIRGVARELFAETEAYAASRSGGVAQRGPGQPSR